MKYFLDTEFIEYPCTIDLISIGIVREDGQEYYAINKECDWSKANSWVREHVIDYLPFPQPKVCSVSANERFETWDNSFKSKREIATEIIYFVAMDKTPEFWGYYADYDWVVFCWLFGTMSCLPPGFPMYCRDIKQLCDSMGNPLLPKMEGQDHNALEDAKHHKKCYEFLTAHPPR